MPSTVIRACSILATGAILALVVAGCDGNLAGDLPAPDASKPAHDGKAGGDGARSPELGSAQEGGGADTITPAPDAGSPERDIGAQPDSGTPQPDGTGQPDSKATQPDSAWGVSDTGAPADIGTSPGSPFGAWCGQGKGPCASGLICVGPLGGTRGFCTKTCPKLGLDCPGAPSGYRSVCAINSPNTKFYCAFLCYSRSMFGAPKLYPCPKPMKCSPKASFPATGQYFCH